MVTAAVRGMRGLALARRAAICAIFGLGISRRAFGCVPEGAGATRWNLIDDVLWQNVLAPALRNSFGLLSNVAVVGRAASAVVVLLAVQPLYLL